MECFLTLNNVSFKYGVDIILDSISLSINRGNKVAIVGANGAGKSTLLHIMSGKITEYDGLRSLKNSLKYEIVEQYLEENLLEYTLLEALLLKLPEEDRILDQQYIAEKILGDLFFLEKDFNTKVKYLSGGGQNRLMFARAIITNPDLIFMDEPTNHMDLKNLLYLEEYLKSATHLSYVIISHDNTFLDRICNRTLYVRDQRIHSFNLNYSDSLVALAKYDEDAEKRRTLEEKEIDRIRKSAHRLAIWGKTYDNESLAKKAITMQKRADKLEDNKTFVTMGNPYSLSLKFQELNSKIALQFHEYKVFYGEHSNSKSDLFAIDKLYINRGEKIALLGDNGVGKSTFIKNLLRDYYDNNSNKCMSWAPNLKIGYYDQEQDVLNAEETVWDAMQRLTKDDNEKIKMALINAGFSYARTNVKIKTLSGGEKSRLMFCALDLQQANFLILDEPTNHIDLEGKKELSISLKNSKITAIITGHDRAFIKDVCDRFIWIKDRKLIEITNPDIYYSNLLKSSVQPENHETNTTNKNIDIAEINDPDLLLEKILQLENKLINEQNRKEKHRNQNLILELEKQISILYENLES